MAKIIAIASGKGGVGKTLITATLSLSLCRKGYKVLAVDCDMGLRNLDLTFGVQDEVFYDAFDVLKERCKPEDAILSVNPELDFLAASQKKTWEKLDIPSYLFLVEQLSHKYDYVILDCPPGRDLAYKSSASLADRIIFTVEPSWSSLRDSERLMRFCDKHKIFEYAILMNNFYQECDNYVSVREVLQMLDPEHIAGILPHDEEIQGAAQNGTLAEVPETNMFIRALGQTVEYIVAENEPDINALMELLPPGFNGNKSVADEWHDKLSLRQRRSQSVAWRRYR